MARNTADALAAVERAQQVSRPSGTVDLLLDQADEVVSDAVRRYNAGTLTDRDAAVAFGTIAQLRSAARKALHGQLKGVEAGEALTGAVK